MAKRRGLRRTRKGRRTKKLATSRRKYNDMLRVPNNIGKTISTLFPSDLRTKLNIAYSFPITGTVGNSDSAATFCFFRGNCIVMSGQAQIAAINSVVPAYGASYPGGIRFLLASGSTTSATPSSGPYNKYMVLGSKIQIRINTEGSTNHSTQHVLFPFSEEVSGKTWNLNTGSCAEQNYMKRIVCPGNLTNRALMLSHGMSTKKMYGLSRNIATEDADYAGDWQSAPLALASWVWVLASNNADGTTTGFSCTATVNIEYDTIFFDRNLNFSSAPT